jgi:uncharacterized protein (DUF736 family)
MANYIVVGGGWSGVSSTGETFVRLKFKNAIPEGVVFTMWKNKHKDTEKHPDYFIMTVVKEGHITPERPEELF